MKLRKIICLLLLTAILIPVIPAFAAGDTTSGASNAYYEVGNDYYSTFSKALIAAEAQGTATISLLKDATETEVNQVVNAGKNITLDLGGHKLNVIGTGAYWIKSVKGKLTLKNGSIDICRGVVVNGGGSLLIDDVDYTVVNTTSNARPAVKLSGAGVTALTVKDSYLKTMGPGEALILVEQSTDGTVTLEGETVLEYAGVLDESPQNCAPVAVQQAWGNGIISTNASSNTDLVLNVGAKSKIVNTAPTSTNDKYVGSVIAVETQGNVVLNLEKGATLAIDRQSGSSKTYFIGETKYNGTVKINDNGANWLVTARALASGNVYLSNSTADGDTVLGWSDGEHLFKVDSAIYVANATKDACFVPVTYSKDDFQMIDGASIRKVPGQLGIRFTTVVSEALVKRLGSTVTFGTTVYKGSTAYGNGERTDIVAEPAKFVKGEDGTLIYHAAIFPEGKDIKAESKVYYSAISYMTVKYSDGTTVNFNTDYDMHNTRSIALVAVTLDDMGYENRAVDDILAMFKGEAAANDGPVLVGVCNSGNYYNGVFDSAGWYAAGMSYIIKTENGKLIVIDGGYPEDAYEIVKLLKLYSNTNDVVVDHWIITHPHGDHVNCLVELAADEELSRKIDINNLVFHFPTDFTRESTCAKYNAYMHAIADQYGAKVINPKKGDMLTVDGAKITFLRVPTNYSSFSSGNQLSMIFTVEINKKIMFTGDAYTDGLTETYNEYGAALKCDILQMPHHYLCDTGYKPFYEAADASEVMLPTCVAGYNAMYNNSSYYNSSKHKANMYAETNADKVYKAFEGTFEIEI